MAPAQILRSIRRSVSPKLDAYPLCQGLQEVRTRRVKRAAPVQRWRRSEADANPAGIIRAWRSQEL